MIRECFVTKTGIMFKADALREVGLDPGRLFPDVLPRPDPLLLEHADPNRVDRKNGAVSVARPGVILTEEEEDLADALSPINDQLSLSPVWWLLELVPMRQKCVRRDGTWGTQMMSEFFYEIRVTMLIQHLRINMANGRFLPQVNDHPIHVHRSVKLRIDHPEVFVNGPYRPRAEPWDRAKPVWVD